MENDLISRSALLQEVINTKVWATGWNKNQRFAIEVLREQGRSFKNIIENQPIVDAAPAKYYSCWDYPTMIKGHEIPVPHCRRCGTHNTDKSKYCPECGAHMKGADKQNESNT